MKKIILSITAILLFIFITAQTASAIGMITEPIVVKDILRGQETLVTLSLFNSENKEVAYGLKVQGQIANWATFYKIDDKEFKNPITEFKMPVKDYADVKVKFSVPKDAPNGTYTGEILAFLASSGEIKSQETSTSVSQQVSREVTITVTDKEIIQLKTAFIPPAYGVQRGKALKIRVLYDNQGNVALKPDLQLKIIKDGNTLYNAIFPYPEGQEAVGGYATKEIPPVEWQTTGQQNGNYKAEFTVFLNGKEMQKETVSFSIGSYENGFLAAISFVGGGNAIFGWLALATVLVVLALALSKANKTDYLKNLIKKVNIF